MDGRTRKIGIKRFVRSACCWAMISGVAAGGWVSAEAAENPAAGAKADEVIIRVGDRAIKRSALDMRKRQVAMKRRQQPSEEEVGAMVDRVVERTLFAQEARALGLDQDPVVKMLIEETVDRILANTYVRKHLLPSVDVSEAEVADYYQAHRNNWKQPETVHARHILLRVSSQATTREIQAVELRSREIRKRLGDGEDFVKLANEVSEDTGTRKNGGDLGFFTRRGKVAAISDTAFALKDGEISQPVRSSVGYHIVQTFERRPPGIKPLEAAKSDIRPRLLREKQVAAATEDRKRLETKYDLYIHESLRLADKANEK